MNIKEIEKLIKDKTVIYYQHIGITKYHVVGVYNITTSVDMKSIPEYFQNRLKSITGQRIALTSVDGMKNELTTLESFIEYYYEPSLKYLDELNRIKEDSSLVDVFFKKHGNLFYDGSKKDKTVSGLIIYGGRSTPDNMWNSEIYYMQLNVRHNIDVNNYSNRFGKVCATTLDVYFNTNQLIDARENASIKKCHDDILLENDKDYTHHYKQEQWLDFIDSGLSTYLKLINETLKDDVEIKYNKKNEFYQQGSNFVIQLDGSNYYLCEFIEEEVKFRDRYCNVAKFKGFDKVMDKTQLIEIITKQYTDYVQQLKDTEIK